MLVLSTGYELYVVDRTGIRWTQEMQARPDASANSTIGDQEMTLFDGVAVSNNQQFVAYVDHAAEIVVRSIRDGTEVSRIPYDAEGETQLRCLSSDGNFVALASVPPDLRLCLPSRKLLSLRSDGRRPASATYTFIRTTPRSMERAR